MITEAQIIYKINALANTHPIKRIDGENKNKIYYQVEDFILVFYENEMWGGLEVFYRDSGIAYFKDYNHIYTVLSRRKRAQTIKEFKIK